MDPPFALAGTTQIPVHCSECNCTLTKWINQTKCPDSSIISFREDLLALQLTYDKLAGSLKDDTMVRTARSTDQYAGGRLWSQMAVVLGQCQTTILSLRQALQSFEYGSRRISTVMKQLAEGLNGGDLFVTREIIRLLDQNITFPVSMINISLQVQQSAMSNDSQKYVLHDLKYLKSEHNGFTSKLQRILTDSRASDNKALRHMQDFSYTVDVFFNTVSASLNQQPTLILKGGSRLPHDAAHEAQAQQHRDLHTTTIDTTEACEELDASASAAQSVSLPEFDGNSAAEFGSEDENEIELELTMEYMANGQADLEVDDFAGAEENFRRALEVAEENDFSKRLEYGPGDITLMLADCLLKQDKEEEALELLEPVADGTAGFIKTNDACSMNSSLRNGTDQGLQYKASHILGTLFLRRQDFHVAEKRAKEAFKGRRRLLGASHAMTLESVQLIIDIYNAKDDKINARAYRRFLEPPSRKRQSIASTSSQIGVGSSSARHTISPEFQRSNVEDLVEESRSASDERSLSDRSNTIRTVGTMAPMPLQTRTTSLTSHAGTGVRSQAHSTTQIPFRASPSPEGTPGSTQIASHSQPQSPVSPKPVPQDRTLTQILENESSHLMVSPVETQMPLTALTAPPPKIEPDPLPPNVSAATTTAKKRMNWSNPFSKSNSNKPVTSARKAADKSSSESSAQDASGNSSVSRNVLIDAKRHMSFADAFNSEQKGFFSKSNDYGDGKSPRPSIASRSYSTSTHPPGRSRQELAPQFTAIKSLRAEGKKNVAVDSAVKLLKEYDPDRKVINVREAELKKNIKESHKALAGTGNGYAPIHFFCERKIEASVEVQLLIEQGVDVNAVAYKAGLPGTDPFTPLQRAAELGHVEIVRLLVEADASVEPPKLAKPTSTIASKEQLTQPLLIACTRGHTEIAHILLCAGAGKILKEFPQRLWHGNSLLHEACWQANTEMVKMLLDYTTYLKNEHRQSGNGRPDYESGVIGSPGQQDQFGVTPIMYAIDLRDCTSDKLRTLKTTKRKDILRMLLEHNLHGELHTHAHRESVARMLSLKWSRGPGEGHSIFCYADEAGDEDLRRLLDPFRYQVSPGMRCSATPQCSTTLRSTLFPDGGIQSEEPGRTVRVPSFPELMSTPIEYQPSYEVPPPSFESAMGNNSPRSPTFEEFRRLTMPVANTTASGRS